jgi:O-acetylhomoserine/O-acetylserine sulfhydrylase-like pyridoxal-dependent enzyme
MDNLTPGVQAFVEQGRQLMEREQKQRTTMRTKKFDTIAVHGLYDMQSALENQGSIIEPAFLATAQHYTNSDHMEAGLAYLMPAWTYARVANPTLHYLEETLALLEGYGFEGEVSAHLTGSGMAAVFLGTNSFLMNDPAHPRPNIVASARCYGGTFTLFTRYANERGVDLRWVRDPLNLEEWASKIDDETRFVFGEMPANPSLAVIDLQAVAGLAHAVNAPFIVDSTIATPALMRPLLHGADIIVHSVSKSMSASGFVIAGAIISRAGIPSKVGPDELRGNYAMYVKGYPHRDMGPTLSPFSALMTLNDLRTLRSRTDITSQTAMTVARWLGENPAVESVQYPGLPGFTGHATAAQYMRLVDAGEDAARYGYLLSFNVRGGALAARQAFDRLQMIWRATDLGRVKSVATIPMISTHQQISGTDKDVAGLQANLIRLSVGMEHPEDIIADLQQALAGA